MPLLESLGVALSTYSAIPVPQFQWNKRNMKYAICFFPAVGLFCGASLALWWWLAKTLEIGAVLFSAGAVALPILITGGIHMDGFMDTVDALSSHQTRERKLAILKDPNCGAFAVLYCGVYLLLSFGLCHEIGLDILVFAPAFVLSRSLSALCAVTMSNARGSGMLCAFTENISRSRAVAAMTILAVLTSAGMVWLSPLRNGLAVLFALLSMLWYRTMAKKEFGGATGDTAGFFLQVCELSMLVGFWLGGAL